MPHCNNKMTASSAKRDLISRGHFKASSQNKLFKRWSPFPRFAASTVFGTPPHVVHIGNHCDDQIRFEAGNLERIEYPSAAIMTADIATMHSKDYVSGIL